MHPPTRAARMLGAILKETPMNPGAKGKPRPGRGKRASPKIARSIDLPTLADAGISLKLSSEAQLLADGPMNPRTAGKGRPRIGATKTEAPKD